MWWALAAAAVPYVMQEMQGQPQQPGIPGQYHMPDRSGYESQYLSNAFNPHAELFQRASDTVSEQVNRELARAGMLGSSAGGALQANTQGTLAAKWLQDQTQRENMALGTVSNMDQQRAQYETGLGNELYQYGAAAYNRNNAWNASQIAGLGGILNAGVDAYGNQRMMNTYDANSKSFQQAMDAMMRSYNNGPSYGAPAAPSYGGSDLYSNYVPMQNGPGNQQMTPGFY